MPLLPKHETKQRWHLRDARPATIRIAEFWSKTDVFAMVSFGAAAAFIFAPDYAVFADFTLLIVCLYSRWLFKKAFLLPFKLPAYAHMPDPHNPIAGKGGAGKSEGILFIGNLDEAEHPDHGRELWLTNSDARTHMLYLGTTGAGKTDGLKSVVSNALTWGSGFVYVDGKADTDLWASLFALSRRFGRDDDLLILNYMTANSDNGATSNTMNPFSTGSASYLTNLVTSLMPDAGGDNAMWKERAIALLGALMPALTYKRDHGGLLLDVSVLREYIELPAIIRLGRDPNAPERIAKGISGYLSTLPGYVDAAFDDEGNERPPAPDQPMYDLQVARQQHGYLSMQFTRSLQSLADEYGYIFKAQLADIDVLDVVLNRRILVALIPSLEKSGDEAANLGKIIVANLKGMMGATLGNTVEGSWENAIGSKQTRSNSSFMAVFDEVGYYTAPGMAVMAAQARSLGFSLIFAAQDLPSMEKRIKTEAQSILANCNMKIFGKIEDPIDTKKFFQDHVGSSWVIESGGMQAPTNTVSSMFLTKQFHDNLAGGGPLTRGRADYDHLRTQREGEAHIFFNEWLVRARMFHAVADRVKALRVHRMLPVPGSTQQSQNRERSIHEIAERLRDPEWTAVTAAAAVVPNAEIAALVDSFKQTETAGKGLIEAGAAALVGLSAVPVSAARSVASETSSASTKGAQGTTAQTAATNGATPYDMLDPDRAQRRAALPSLHEGDEYAIQDLQTFPAQEKKQVAATNKSVVQAGAKDAFESHDSERNYIPDDIDMNIMVRPGDDSEDFDVMNTALPDDIAILLQQSAQKLNQGLGGHTHVGDAE